MPDMNGRALAEEAQRNGSQGTGGSVTSITTSLVENPIAGVPASIPMITKGGLDAITRSLASVRLRDVRQECAGSPPRSQLEVRAPRPVARASSALAGREWPPRERRSAGRT
jgi:hypothetical protein